MLELGAGHGRDALYFAREGFTVQATDFSPVGLEQLRDAAQAQGLAGHVSTAVHDVRDPLPMSDAYVDAVFAHMLLCMALSTKEIHAAAGETRRVLRPGGTLVYTVRHTGDGHYGAGISHGDGIYEHGGFAVHFFPRRLVDALAGGWDLAEVHAFEEGELPRRLWRVTQTVPPMSRPTRADAEPGRGRLWARSGQTCGDERRQVLEGAAVGPPSGCAPRKPPESPSVPSIACLSGCRWRRRVAS